MFPIDITPEAIEAFKEKIAVRGTPTTLIRFGIKGGSCNGYSYAIQFEDEPPRPGDNCWSIDGVNFAVDKKSLLFLSGSRVNWKKTLMYQGFDFENPQEASRCGCGESFSIK